MNTVMHYFMKKALPGNFKPTYLRDLRIGFIIITEPALNQGLMG